MIVALLLAAAVAAPPGAIPDCLGKPKVKPSAIVLACADANFGLKHLHWLRGGETTTADTVTAPANSGTPHTGSGSES